MMKLQKKLQTKKNKKFIIKIKKNFLNKIMMEKNLSLVNFY